MAHVTLPTNSDLLNDDIFLNNLKAAGITFLATSADLDGLTDILFIAPHHTLITFILQWNQTEESEYSEQFINLIQL